ncbi:MAG: UDP-N-acetylmuramoylalanine--D-glutamate ligase [Phycisphaerae bacterium]|nr:UDP-N-acetylmuramoylalanine--D-glutamate ligase [Phycisphaerae bacterium]
MTNSNAITNWSGRRVTVVGLGRFGGGTGVTRWLAAQGAHLTVTDLAPAEKLARSLAEIAGLDVRLRLGGHDEADFRDTDLVVASPAVPQQSPFLQIARSAGVPVSSEMNLFVERCRGRCIGVTGSVGKSTITAMIGHVLEHTRDDSRRVYVGGNIGRSLLDALPQIRDGDWVVLELSSFQLEVLAALRWSPSVAVISNVTPNHLDRHGNFAAYLAAKLNIIRFQDPARDLAVMQDAPELRRNIELMFGDVSGLWRYGLVDGVASARLQSTPAVDCDDRKLSWPCLSLDVPGLHNRLNAAAALCVAHVAGVDADRAVAAMASFQALPHRLQRVGRFGGVAYFNDSKSTTPESALMAIDAVQEHTAERGQPTATDALTPARPAELLASVRPAALLMILGGYDKGIDLRPLCEVIARRAAYSACIGQTGPRMAQHISAAGGDAEYVESLASAVAACRRRARPGDVVLLSPACASTDMFEDYRARGDAFVALASA